MYHVPAGVRYALPLGPSLGLDPSFEAALARYPGLADPAAVAAETVAQVQALPASRMLSWGSDGPSGAKAGHLAALLIAIRHGRVTRETLDALGLRTMLPPWATPCAAPYAQPCYATACYLMTADPPTGAFWIASQIPLFAYTAVALQHPAFSAALVDRLLTDKRTLGQALAPIVRAAVWRPDLLADPALLTRLEALEAEDDVDPETVAGLLAHGRITDVPWRLEALATLDVGVTGDAMARALTAIAEQVAAGDPRRAEALTAADLAPVLQLEHDGARAAAARLLGAVRVADAAVADGTEVRPVEDEATSPAVPLAVPAAVSPTRPRRR